MNYEWLESTSKCQSQSCSMKECKSKKQTNTMLIIYRIRFIESSHLILHATHHLNHKVLSTLAFIDLLSLPLKDFL